ncbi:MAG: TIGR00268 family protein, partial [Eisenbergiella porci]|nr:TIGR00268 family protein [Eisenbergiella porci]
MEGTEEKRQKLTEMMDKLAGEDIMVAFSGGVDSSLLLKAACDSAGQTGKKVYAVT